MASHFFSATKELRTRTVTGLQGLLNNPENCNARTLKNCNARVIAGVYNMCYNYDRMN